MLVMHLSLCTPEFPTLSVSGLQAWPEGAAGALWGPTAPAHSPARAAP